jgi:GTP-binding protein HflX
MTSEEKNIVSEKPNRRSLVTAQEAAFAARRDRPQTERAVLVAVEFTGQRRKLTSAARMARGAAAVAAGSALDDSGVEDFREQPLAQSPRATDLDWDASLAEFEELACSAGAEVAATLVQRRPRPDPATLVGQGKLEEIEGVVASTGADLVLFDHDLTPSQLRNLEAKLPCRVIDRTQLILDIFARPGRASCRWSWRSWSISCHDWQGGARRCLNWAAALERAGQAKLSSRPTAARSICALTM